MARRKRGQYVDGWILLDKPVGVSSTSAVSRVQRVFDARKAGHAGTLDPLASGMLPIALGEATKTIPYIVDGAKTYRFSVTWGEQRDTDDGEGDVVATSENRPNPDDIRGILDRYRGRIEQVPPAFSAIKIDGQRAYDLARGGESVELKPRQVEIHRFELLDGSTPDVAHFEVDCGKGTYIRALARDMGRDLGCFGYISALRRTRVCPYSESQMISLDKLEDLRHKGAGQDELTRFLLPVETALDDIPALAISEADAVSLRNGQAILVRGRDAPVLSGTAYAMFKGTLVALGEVRGGQLHPKRVFQIAG
ncbi:MAG: tRNA pseudouridine(55) synthase TruB [Fimbriimonadaceae bacterium]|nr:tRNA pseudouridine(55) synthase TruB [Alphaproteobacteria bacterium]